MPTGSAARRREEAPGSSLSVADVEALRALLAGPERARLDAIERRLTEDERLTRDLARRAADHSEVLAESLRLATERDEALSEALRPEVERGVLRSVREDPNTMAEALYPVLGPAVRKLIASMFQPDSSGRGRPYRVEQLFFMHRDSSLVLHHQVLDTRAARDADVVSGMLDAIRSFVQEAFDAHDFDGMRSLNVGDITVWVEWGPQAVLAVVVRGFAPESLREAYADVLRRLHVDYHRELERFDGDVAPFASLEERLPDWIGDIDGGSGRASGRVGWIAIALGACLLGAMAWISDTLSDERRWTRLLARLDATPGIVVIDSAHEDGMGWISALRDPLADAPEPWLASPEMSKVTLRARWTPFVSLEEELVLRRVHRVLGADSPLGVTLERGILRVDAGDAVPDERLLERLRAVPGVESIALSRASDEGGAAR